MHVSGLVAPIVALYVDNPHAMHVANELAFSVSLYIPAGHVTHAFLSNDVYIPGPHASGEFGGCISDTGSETVPTVIFEDASSLLMFSLVTLSRAACEFDVGTIAAVSTSILVANKRLLTCTSFPDTMDILDISTFKALATPPRNVFCFS